MLRVFFVAVLSLFSSSLSAAEYRVTQRHWIPGADNVQAIDPILSPTDELLGVVCLKFDRLEILLYDRDSLITIITNPDPNNFQYPISMANQMQDDSLVIYVDYDIGFYGTDSTFLQKVTLIDNSISFDTAHYAIPVMWNYRGRNPNHQYVRFERGESGTPIRLIIEKTMTYDNFSSGGAEWWNEDLSTTLFIDLSSLALTERFDYPFMERGRFSASTDRQFAAYGMHYLDYQEPNSSGYYRFSSMQLLDSTGHTDFQVNFPYGNQWLAVGDVSDSHPYDEVLYYGLNAGLDGAHAPAQLNLSCYNFSTGSPEQIWYLPISGIQPECLFERASVLMAWRGDSTLLFINASNGEIFDSTVIENHPSVKRAFSYWDDSPLHAAVLVGDTAKILQFDAVVDVSEEGTSLPAAFTLSQNYPNPFNATTEINFSLARTGNVSLTVYNLLGQEVRILVDGSLSAGEHRVTWDGIDNSGNVCASGIYLYRFNSDETALSRKMILLK